MPEAWLPPAPDFVPVPPPPAAAWLAPLLLEEVGPGGVVSSVGGLLQAPSAPQTSKGTNAWRMRELDRGRFVCIGIAYGLARRPLPLNVMYTPTIGRFWTRLLQL